jgi:hypothetical protein
LIDDGEKDVCDVVERGAHVLEVVEEEAENSKLLGQKECDRICIQRIP